MEEKNIKRLFYLMIILSVCVALISMLSDASWKLRFDFEFLLFVIWIISPYICVYSVDVGLKKIYSRTYFSLKMSPISCNLRQTIYNL
jgi:hypothetical protein